MLEIKERDGLARTATWEPEGKGKVDGRTIVTPAVLFLTGPRFPPFPGAEVLLARAGPDIPGGTVLTDGGGPFQRRVKDQDIDIPAGRSCPMTLEAFLKEGPGPLGRDGRVMIVGPRPPRREEVPDTVELIVAGNIQGLLGDPKRLVGHVATIRETIGYSRLIHAPGVGKPSQMAFLSYLGIDLFDSVPLALAARNERMLFPDGEHDRSGVMDAVLCSCPACSEGGTDGPYDINLHHNYHSALAESRRVRHSISRGTLRELVEGRVRNDPWQVAALRELDLRYHDLVERYLPIAKPFLLATSRESLHRAEVVRFQRRLKSRYRRPPSASVLLLLPCSARKPYSFSSTHRAISDAVSRCKAPGLVHKVVLTSPLGVVPMELELFYPANVYDIAVTGDWDGPEIEMIRDGLSWLLGTCGYDGVVSYIDGMPFIEDLLEERGDLRVLRPRDPRRGQDLDDLVHALDDILEKVDRPKGKRKRRLAEDMASFSRFQFGPGGEGLVERAKRTRHGIRLFAGNDMTGTLTIDRGLISLALHGGDVLLPKGLYIVEIDDFEPKGTVFAVGVNGASDGIRPRDDVVVSRGGAMAGVGVALMSGPEMIESKRGGAVRLRHRRKGGGVP